MPATILKFRSNGDEATAKLLEDTIYKVHLHLAAESSCMLAISNGAVLVLHVFDWVAEWVPL